LICEGRSQIFELSHPFKGAIINLYIVTSSCILIEARCDRTATVQSNWKGH